MREFVVGWKSSYWPEGGLRPKAKVDGWYKKENEVREVRVRVSKTRRLVEED